VVVRFLKFLQHPVPSRAVQLPSTEGWISIGIECPERFSCATLSNSSNGWRGLKEEMQRLLVLSELKLNEN
jgi:hypothetical protein